jgi:hypothetical protein
MQPNTSTAPPAGTPATRGARIDALERELHGLYAQRAGRMEPGQDWGWCASCGRASVFPAEGEDTCQECLAELTVDRAGRWTS